VKRHAASLALEVVVVAAAFALWAFVSAGSQDFYFPPLAEILDSFAANWVFERIGSDVLPSLFRVFAGFFLATSIGVGVGVALGGSRSLRSAFGPLLDFLHNVPPPALIPFALLVFGIGESEKIFLIVLGCVWPILLATSDGVAEIDPVTRDTARAYGIRGPRGLWNVVLPAAAPRIAAGMRTSLSLAVILMVISEMVASTEGIGYFIVEAQRSFAIADMWSGILMLGLIGYALNLGFELAERRLLWWRAPAPRAAAKAPREATGTSGRPWS
jgi:ABC-type nitrate/sulfonate/bicarbonate transport system permease component